MSGEAEVALAATTEAVVTPETASEATENTEGQAPPPVVEEQVEAQKTASQERRERRKAHEQELRDKAESATREAEDLRRKVQRLSGATGEPPKEADFADAIEYAAALGAFKARQSGTQTDARFADEDAKAADARATEAKADRMRLRLEAFQDQAQDAKKTYADFDQVVAVAADARFVSQGLSELILESDQSADLAYHLGKNPALALQLSQMPLIAAAREIGRIEAAMTKPQPKTQTNAPAPITPVNGRGSPSKDPDKMTLAEFTAWRAAGGTPERG